MNNKNETRAPTEDGTESVTGEYAVIDGDALNGHALSPSPSADERPAASAQAAFWLTHLETEVGRLHAKWQSIDAEIKTREARIADLREDLKARDAVVEKLAAAARRDEEALLLADQRLQDKEAEVAALAADRLARDAKIDGMAAELTAAEDRNSALRRDVEASRAEVARLDAAIREGRATAADLAKYNDDLLASQAQLKIRLQELEGYIDGRHQKWAELNAQVADYKDALIGMEKALKERDGAAAQHEVEKQRLATRILELERQCSELAGRRKEREAAYEELQRALTQQLATVEQLKAEHARSTKDAEQATASEINSRKKIESLERGIERRDENLAALTTERDAQRAAVNELSAARDKLTKRTEELEKGVGERAQQIQALREELRSSHAQSQMAQQQLDDRNAQLATSQAALAEKTRALDSLTSDLRAHQSEIVEVRREFEKLEAHAEELGRLRADALAEAGRLKAELGAQQELIASLENELRLKQATADFLERNVGRITDLGASLAALDRDLGQPEEDAIDEEQPDDAMVFHLSDHAATVASAEPRSSSEMLPMEVFFSGDKTAHDVVDIGEAEAGERFRKLVALIDGHGIDYPLRKSEMIIGRGHDSDIRIPSHFISRRHAKVSTHGIATVIEDAGSKNGILVNSERVHRRVLRDGDVVSLGGELSLRFVDAAP